MGVEFKSNQILIKRCGYHLISKIKRIVFYMIIKNPTKSKSNLSLILIMLFFIAVSSFLSFSISVFFIQILAASLTIPLIMKKSYYTAKIYIIIYIVSIFFVFLIYIANQETYDNSYYIGGSDDLAFEHKGMLVANSGIYNPQELLGTILDMFDNSPFFIIYMAILYNFSNFFDGYSTFIPRVMNVYFLIWVVMIFEYLIKKYGNFSERKVNLSIAVFALTPNIQFINSHVFRDTFNLLQILLIVFLIDKIISRKNVLKIIILFVALYFLIYITYYTRANSIVFAGVLALLVIAKKAKIKTRYIMILFIPLIMLSNFLESINLDYFIENYSNYVLTNAGEGLSSIIFSLPLLPLGIIFRAFYALIIPFPDFFGLFHDPNRILLDFVMLIIYFGVIIQIIFIPFIFKSLLKLNWLALSFLVVFIGIIATTFTFRHVILYFPFLVALGVDGYQSSSKNNKIYTLFFWIITTIMLALVYVLLKLFT